MSKSSSVSSNIRTLMVTCRPGGMAGGLCPGSNVLMPRVSGAPRRCPAPEAIGSGSGSAMMHCNEHCPACREAKRGNTCTCSQSFTYTCIHGNVSENMKRPLSGAAGEI